MKRFLILRLDAPLMSAGGAAVDHHGPTMRFVGRSMLTGLLGNALGLDHRESDALQRLQARVRHGVREDLPGTIVIDYQTVDLSQRHLLDEVAWTSRGAIQPRKGGSSSTGTHQRYRHYLADTVLTVALSLEPTDESPTLDDLARALRAPARPLFIGRKPCIPSGPLLLTELTAPDLQTALSDAPLSSRAASGPRYSAWWDGAPEGPDCRPISIYDQRDWRNQIHAGRRELVHGSVAIRIGDAP